MTAMHYVPYPDPASRAVDAMSDKVSGQLGELERWLRLIAEQTEPVELRYSNSSSDALEQFRVAKSGAGRLYGFSGFNTNASAQFILGFDAVTVPVNGAVPNFVMQAAGSSNFWASWTPAWRNFQRGWILLNSATSATLTKGAADCWFDVQYQ
jgi:hypothetical protein